MIDLKSLPVKDYAHVRPEIRTGDLVIASGRSLYSRLIRYGTHSQASHVGILVRVADLDRVLLLESVATGVRFSPFSRLIWGEPSQRYDGEVALFHWTERPTPAGFEIASQWALDQLTVGYSWRKIAYLALRLTLKMRWLPVPPGEEVICSEFFANFYRRAGVPIEPDPDLGIVTPSQLLSDPRAELIDRIL